MADKPGKKNNDGYWHDATEDILKQSEENNIPAFDQMNPEASGPFEFDNSTNDGAYAPDALLVADDEASEMNLGPGWRESSCNKKHCISKLKMGRHCKNHASR